MSKSIFERGDVKGIRVHVMPTNRFKTFTLAVYVGIPLQEDTVTPIALIPFVLRRGTTAYPETIRFRERLEELYGAEFGFDIYKRGNYQIIQFRIDVINDTLVHAVEPLLGQILQFMGGVLTAPILEGGAFHNNYVTEETEILRQRIDSVINDKIRYAAERCLEEMCKAEPYRLPALGFRDKLDGFTSQSLYNQYRWWLEHAAIDVYVVGDTTFEGVEHYIHQFFDGNRVGNASYVRSASAARPEKSDTVIERLDISQGKLNLGLRSTVTYADHHYSAALLFNGVLGGYPHSKLFTHIREKNSLAYYASSRLDGHQGICMIQSGIEFHNFEQALLIIKEQLAAMKAGQIERLELDQTKALIINQLREINDSAFDLIGFDFNGVLSGRERAIAQLVDEIEQTDKMRIQEVAQTFYLNLIYFLRNREGV